MAQILIAINDLNVKGAEVRIVTSLRPAAVGCSVTRRKPRHGPAAPGPQTVAPPSRRALASRT